jgi:drug/metabolite transporter (DMT)-like permease
MHGVVPAVLALTAAFLAAVGTVIRKRATGSTGGIDRTWFLGAAVAVGAFVFQVGALALGTVLLVQPLLALAVLFELFVQTWWTKHSPSPRQWLYGSAVGGGVIVFVFFARPVPARHGRQQWLLDVVVIGLLIALFLATLIARRTSGNLSGVLYGVVAGSLFGIVAVLINSLSEPFPGMQRTVSNPTLYICIATAIAAIVAQQSAFTRGALEASYPAMVASEPIVAMGLSLVVLGEKLSSHDISSYISVAGVAVMLVGVIGLAHSEALTETPAHPVPRAHSNPSDREVRQHDR